MKEIIMLILLTFLPFLELRASIPYGIFNADLSVVTIFFICVVANIILAPLIYFFLNNFIHIFLKIKFIDKLYQKTVIKTQKKVSKYVEKYGVLGLAIFIGIPLPGSGVYSGALGAYLLGFKFKDFFKAAVIGVIIAGIIVLLVTTLGNGAWSIFIKNT
ncbi:MAG: small multi-drug export protein [Nanoarchaeota archaeon]|nr:small multi-drug export protein [Nanoarchaeota archaeon]MBU1643701.1 small multi-drug export protein [Nanoarchaeota archaeon]MBU1977317.1 small multi-drug export protein [Nanoarchaeota archaeon]